MKEYYDTQIKPANKALGQKLGIKTIEVDYKESVREIPVLYRTQGGHVIKLTASERNLYRNALGLMV